MQNRRYQSSCRAKTRFGIAAFSTVIPSATNTAAPRNRGISFLAWADTARSPRRNAFGGSARPNVQSTATTPAGIRNPSPTGQSSPALKTICMPATRKTAATSAVLRPSRPIPGMSISAGVGGWPSSNASASVRRRERVVDDVWCKSMATTVAMNTVITAIVTSHWRTTSAACACVNRTIATMARRISSARTAPIATNTRLR